MPPRKLILKNHQAPGDILMLTAAVRDLWRLNPWITPLNDEDHIVERLH